MVVDPATKKCTVCDEMFEGCGTCTADVCETCSDPNWLYTENGCFLPERVPFSDPLASDTPKSESANEIGKILGIIVGCLVGVAIVLAVVYLIKNRKPNNEKFNQMVDEEAQFGAEMDEMDNL